jgi:hypothetical protein
VRSRPALAAGVATACLVGAASLLAWRSGSPLVPRDGGTLDQGTAWPFFALLAAAFGCYLAGLLLLRRVSVPVRAVAVVAALVQLVPLGAPLLLSTDAWTYWSYGWIAADGGGNPYVDPPSKFPQNPAVPYMGADWRDTTTVYGPAFTGLSEPVAKLAGTSSDTAAWLYKGLAAVAMLAACVAVARTARRAALAAAFVGWNPVLAVHAAGGGHNDALVGGLAALAVALALRRRHELSGAVWVAAVLVKWVPLLFLALSALAERAGVSARSAGAASPPRPLVSARSRRGSTGSTGSARRSPWRGTRPARRATRSPPASSRSACRTASPSALRSPALPWAWPSSPAGRCTVRRDSAWPRVSCL